jgi:CDP-glucose 4,6-dehydratase
VYENRGTGDAFLEGDRLGGHDPYSASKAAAELAVVPYRSPAHLGLRDVPVVTVRAGNVVGGWDRSPDRLVPDAIRALELGTPLVLRRPDATRPWQHVLDCLWGYLLVADRLLAGGPCPPALNLAHGDGARTVLEVAQAVVDAWGGDPGTIVIEREDTDAEASLLQLDASLARQELGWRSPWTIEETIVETVQAYRSSDPAATATEQIERYVESARGSAP